MKPPSPSHRDVKDNRKCRFRTIFQLMIFTVVFASLVSYMQNAGGSLNIAVDEKKSLFRPRHKEVPVQPIKKPYEPKLSYENDICFHKTSNLSNTPWDKCKMSFVPPNVTLVSPPLDNITIGDDVHYRIESNKLEIPRDGCVSGGNFCPGQASFLRILQGKQPDRRKQNAAGVLLRETSRQLVGVL
ncbi:uncharacterized protein LOC117292768 [Asterias rubens]|uniref:uncharacterized protein LOC117292768 n=1 Tax=Asterias rubens TaxID=7604 RepID=UPI001454EA85|nr:uncharacterized protein LOC117292768 [Asterias rubens]